MKKSLFRTLTLILSFIAASLWTTANPIDSVQAKSMARHFFSVVAPQCRGIQPKIVYHATYMVSPVSILNRTGESVSCFYVVNMGDIGFVIVSADDCAKPLLGYSTNGVFNPEQIPIGLNDILEGYRYEIGNAICQNHHATTNLVSQWEAIYNHRLTTRNVVVEPLIQTTWDQAPYYNSMCPIYVHSGDTVQSVTGCTATAIAQIFKFWEWPVYGIGSNTYNTTTNEENPVDLYGITADFGNTIYLYDLMPNVLDVNTHPLMKEQVSRLMYHCGVSMNTRYGVTGSSVYMYDIPLAFFHFDFSYADYEISSSHTLTQWQNLLKSDIDEGMPVLYNGSRSLDDVSHLFICDGYDSNDYFHFNFGWGGIYDGYYTISGTDVHQFNYGQSAFFGLKPNHSVCEGESCGITIEVSNNINNACGWDGAYMVVYQGEKAIKGITLSPTLHSNIVTIDACEDSLHFEWFSGNNDAACRFVIRNADNDTLYYMNGNPTQGRFLSVNYSCSECPSPIHFNISDIGEEEATLSWTSGGNLQDYNIEYGPAGFMPGTGVFIPNVQPPFHFEDLSAEHSYDVYVQANCGDNSVSYWSSKINFTTLIWCNDDNNRNISTSELYYTTKEFPIDNTGNFLYSYTQQLISYSELNDMGITASCRINSISFQTYGFTEQVLDNISIYIGQTDSNFQNNSFIPTNQMTLVYSGSIHLHGGMSWNDITFQTPFYYAGDRSIVIAVLNNSGTALSTSGNFYCHFGMCRCLMTKSNTMINTDSLPLFPSSANIVLRNNMKFNVCIAGYACNDVALTLDTAVCENDFPFTWNGVTFEDGGSGTSVITFGGGCDSVITMNVTKKFHSYNVFSVENCGEYVWNGETYYISGDYTQYYTASNGCDSIVTLHLTIHPEFAYVETLNLCRTQLPYIYEPENVIFEENSTSGEFIYPHTTVFGCDSIVILQLTILEATEKEITAEECGTFLYEDYTFDTSGDYVIIYTNSNGCDSVVTFHITIHPMPMVTILGNTQISIGGSTILVASGADTYVWSTGETTSSITVSPTVTTTYYVTGITPYGCTDTASVTVMVTSSIDIHTIEKDILLYPNPATQTVTIQLDENSYVLKEVTIYDASGCVIYCSNFDTYKAEVDITNWASGLYFCRVVCGDKVMVKKFAKE